MKWKEVQKEIQEKLPVKIKGFYFARICYILGIICL